MLRDDASTWHSPRRFIAPRSTQIAPVKRVNRRRSLWRFGGSHCRKSVLKVIHIICPSGPPWALRTSCRYIRVTRASTTNLVVALSFNIPGAAARPVRRQHGALDTQRRRASRPDIRIPNHPWSMYRSTNPHDYRGRHAWLHSNQDPQQPWFR